MKTIAMTGMIVALMSGVAVAGEAEKMPGKDAAATTETSANFTALDTNADGYISGQEAAADTGVNSSFSQLDSDKDDRLSAEEFSEYKVKSKY